MIHSVCFVSRFTAVLSFTPCFFPFRFNWQIVFELPQIFPATKAYLPSPFICLIRFPLHFCHYSLLPVLFFRTLPTSVLHLFKFRNIYFFSLFTFAFFVPFMPFSPSSHSCAPACLFCPPQLVCTGRSDHANTV